MNEFEKRYDGLAAEPATRQFWADEKLYDFDPADPRPLYSIDTPPPTVSGSLHIGHIFSYTQAEIIARHRRMTGYNVYYPFGFDDNGLPSERLTEKETGVKARDLPRSEFGAKCRETCEKYEAEFKALWQKMGFSCDWNLQYNTVSPESMKISQLHFLDLVKKGKLYPQESPVLWCTECQTSIAQAELDTKDVASSFNHIPFTITETGDVLEIATTRPELLYSVVCIFVHPDDERYTHLHGKQITVPLYNFTVPLLTDPKVAIDKGTGAVMCATFGDTTDLEWFKEHNLPYKKTILSYGKIADEVPFIGGLRVKAARKEIIRLLDEAGLLLKSAPLTHPVSTHERCGTEIEIIPSRQWYIDVLNQKEELLAAADKINFYPPQMKNRFVTWIENLKWDWCVSRQRYFGVPFPVWYCEDCGKPHFATADMLPVNPIETAYEGTCTCGCTSFKPETAVLDTWATSSLTPMINREKFGEIVSTPHRVAEDNPHGTYHPSHAALPEWSVAGGRGLRAGNESPSSPTPVLTASSGAAAQAHPFMPMSMRTQAHEIIRTWAFYTVCRSLYHTGEIPWQDMMVCGFVLAKPGEKISKSKGNAKITPEGLLSSYPADMIRYWSANARLGTDMYFDLDGMIDQGKRFLTKLWNASKFACSHLEDFDVNAQPALLPIDRWMVERVREVTHKCDDLLKTYEVGLARHLVDELFWSDFCDNYIEIVKERLYQPDFCGAAARSAAQTGVYFALLNILKLYAIFVPHITEAIYQKGLRGFAGANSIHTLQWESAPARDPNTLLFGEAFKAALAVARKIKSENNMSMRESLPSIDITFPAALKEEFLQNEPDLKACTHAETINVTWE